jgi:hypothetical protein
MQMERAGFDKTELCEVKKRRHRGKRRDATCSLGSPTYLEDTQQRMHD